MNIWRKNATYHLYECVGDKLNNQKQCHVDGITCTPYTFPNNQPPICPKNKTIEDCEWNGYGAILSAMKKCLGQKPCITEYYEFFLNQDWSTVDPLRAKIMLEDLIGQEQRDLIEKLKQRQMDKYVILLEFASGNSVFAVDSHFKWSNTVISTM